MLEALIAIWTRDPVKFEGQFYHIPESKIGPKPAYARRFTSRASTSPDPHREIRGRVESGGRSRLKALRRRSISCEDSRPRRTAPDGSRADGVSLVMETSLVTSAVRSRERSTRYAKNIKRLSRIGVTCHSSIPEMTHAPSQTIDPAVARLEQLIDVTR